MFNVTTYYFVAHKGEARVYIQKLKLSQTKNKNIYTNKNTVLTITGMGKDAADKLQQTFQLYPPNSDTKVINLGIAGCADENVKIGTVFDVGSLHYKDDNINLHEGANCHSFETVQNEKFNGFLCDMESFFLVKEALKHVEKQKIKVYKVVSDHLKDAKIPNKDELNSWMQKVYEYEKSSHNRS